MKVISHRVDRLDGSSLAVAVDGDWDQKEIETVRPDTLQYVPVPPGRAERRGPNKLHVYHLSGQVETYQCAGFEVEEDAANMAIIRHYTLGVKLS